MKIMIFDVPAEAAGSLAILYDFYNEYKVDINNEYIFVISKPELKETENIKVLRYPWIKNSWFHRLFFDRFIAPKLIVKYKVDEVLSLQNIIIPHTKIQQTVYVHNALPFSEYRFSITENRFLWIYQNVLSKLIFKSIKKAKKVIVQTKWMKNECVNKLKVDKKKIQIMPPKVNIKVKKYFNPTEESLSTFFYPASALQFKNHKVIVDACLDLKSRGINNYKVIFTLNGDENRNIALLYKKIKENDLPINFIGSIERDEVFEYYSKAVLIFPSYIETVGLPLVEAKLHETPILASDCIYSKEIIDTYERVRYFQPFRSSELREEMYKMMKENITIKI